MVDLGAWLTERHVIPGEPIDELDPPRDALPNDRPERLS